jgi:hypothetical protein
MPTRLPPLCGHAHFMDENVQKYLDMAGFGSLKNSTEKGTE